MSNKFVRDLLVCPDEPSVDHVSFQFIRQPQKNSTIILKNKDYIPVEGFYSLYYKDYLDFIKSASYSGYIPFKNYQTVDAIKPTTASNTNSSSNNSSQQLSQYHQEPIFNQHSYSPQHFLKHLQPTMELSREFFQKEPQNEHIELEYYWFRTTIGVSSKEYHTTTKEISMENFQEIAGKRNVESLSDAEFELLLQEHQEKLTVSDSSKIIRKTPKKQDDKSGGKEGGDVQDGAKISKGEHGGSKTKSDLKKSTELKRQRCQAVLSKLELIEIQLKEYVPLISKDPAQLERQKSKLEALQGEYKIILVDVKKIENDWSTQPPVEGHDLMEDIRDVRVKIDGKFEQLWDALNKYASSKLNNEIIWSFDKLYDQLIQLRVSFGQCSKQQPINEDGWKKKSQQIQKIEQDLDEIKTKCESLSNQVKVKNIVWKDGTDPSERIYKLYTEFYYEFTVYLVTYYKEVFTRGKPTKESMSRAYEEKSKICTVYLYRLKELQRSLKDLLSDKGTSNEEKKNNVEVLRSEIDLINKSIDTLEIEWGQVNVGQGHDPILEVNEEVDRLYLDLDRARSQLYKPPKNLSKKETSKLKVQLFTPHLENLQKIKFELNKYILADPPPNETEQQQEIRLATIQKLSRELDNERKRIDALLEEWKEIPVEGLSIENESEATFNEVQNQLKRIPRGADGKFYLKQKPSASATPTADVSDDSLLDSTRRLAYQGIIDEWTALVKQLNSLRASFDRSDVNQKTKEKNKKKIEEIEGNIERLKDNLKKEGVDLNSIHIEGYDPYSNVTSIVKDILSSPGDKGKDTSTSTTTATTATIVTTTTTAAVSTTASATSPTISTTTNTTVVKSPFQDQIDLLSVLFKKLKELNLKEKPKDSKQNKEREQKIKEIEKEIEQLKLRLDKQGIDWSVVCIEGYDPSSSVSSLFKGVLMYPEPAKPKPEDSGVSQDRKDDVLLQKQQEYDPLLEKLSTLQQAWTDLSNQILPKKSKLKKEREEKIKQLEKEMDGVKDQLSKLDEKWKTYPAGESVNPVKVAFDMFSNSKPGDKAKPDESTATSGTKKEERTTENKEKVYKPLLDRLMEVDLQLEEYKQQLQLHPQQKPKLSKERIKSLQDESNKLTKDLEALELEWSDVGQLPVEGDFKGKEESISVSKNPSLVFKNLKKKIDDDFKVVASEGDSVDALLKKTEEKKNVYDPLLKKLSDLQRRWKEYFQQQRPVTDDEQLQQAQAYVQSLEKEMDDVRKSLDALDLQWKGVKVVEVDDPVKSTSDLLNTFKTDIQSFKIKLPKKEDLIKQKTEEKKKAYDPLLKKLSDLQLRWKEYFKQREKLPITDEEQLQEAENYVQSLEKEIDDVKKSLDALDLQWKGVKVEVVDDPAKSSTELVSVFKTDLQTFKVKLPRQEDIVKQKTEEKKKAYDPLLKKLSDLQLRWKEYFKQREKHPVTDEEQLQRAQVYLQGMEKEINDVKIGLDVLNLQWKNVKVIAVDDPVKSSSDLVDVINNDLQSFKVKLPKKEELLKKKTEEKKKAYDPLLKKLSELQLRWKEYCQQQEKRPVTDEEQLQQVQTHVQDMEKQIDDVKKSLDALDLQWKDVKVEVADDPVKPSFDLVNSFKTDLQSFKVKLPKKEEIIKMKTSEKKKAYDPLLKKLSELQLRWKEYFQQQQQPVSDERQLQEAQNYVQGLEREIDDVKKGLDALDLQWKGVKVEAADDPVKPSSDLVNTLKTDLQSFRVKLPTKEDIVKMRTDEKRKAYDPLLKKLADLQLRWNEYFKEQQHPFTDEKELQEAQTHVESLEREIDDVKKGLDALDLQWKAVKVEAGDDPVGLSSDLVNSFKTDLQSFKVKLPKKDDIIKMKTEEKKKAYDPLLKKLADLQLAWKEFFNQQHPVSDEGQLQKAQTHVQSLEKEIDDVKKGLDALDLQWKGVKVEVVDEPVKSSDLVNDLKTELQSFKVKLPKKEEIVKMKTEEKNKVYDPLLKKLSDLQSRWKEYFQQLEQHPITDDGQLQQTQAYVQGLEREIDDVKKGLDALDLQWKGVKVEAVDDPVKTSSDLVNKFKTDLQSFKIKLPKKEDIVKLKTEEKKKVYDPLLSKLSELQLRWSAYVEQQERQPITSEEQVQQTQSYVQGLEKEIDEVKNSLDTLDLQWKDVKVEAVDNQMKSVADTLLTFKTDVQNIKRKIPTKDDIVKLKSEEKVNAYKPGIKKLTELEQKVSEFLKEQQKQPIKNEQQLLKTKNDIQVLEKECDDVKKGLDTLELQWKNVKVDSVHDPVKSADSLIQNVRERLQGLKVKLPKKEDLAKQTEQDTLKSNGTRKLKAYRPLIDRLNELQRQVNECGFMSPVDPVLIREKYQNIKDLEMRIDELTNQLDSLDRDWETFDVRFEPGVTDPTLEVMSKMKKLENEFKAVKAESKFPKKEVNEHKQNMYQPLLKKIADLKQEIAFLLPLPADTCDAISKNLDTLKGKEKTFLDITKDLEALETEWQGITLPGVDPTIVCREEFNSLNEQLKRVKHTLNKEKNDRNLLESKGKDYKQILDRVSPLKTSLDKMHQQLQQPKQDSRATLEAKNQIKDIEKELTSIGKLFDSLDSKWKDVASKDKESDPKTIALEEFSKVKSEFDAVNNKLNASLKDLDDEKDKITKNFNDKVNSLEVFLSLHPAWQSLEGYNVDRSTMLNLYANLLNFESRLDNNVNDVKIAYGDVTEKLNVLNTPEAVKDRETIKKKYDTIIGESQKLKKKLSDKKVSINNTLTQKQKLKKQSAADAEADEKAYESLKKLFDGQTHGVLDFDKFNLENPDLWLKVQKGEKIIPQSMKSYIQDQMKLVRDIDGEITKSQPMRNAFMDLQVINKEKHSTVKIPSLNEAIDSKMKVKPVLGKLDVAALTKDELDSLKDDYKKLEAKFRQKAVDQERLKSDLLSFQVSFFDACKHLKTKMDDFILSCNLDSSTDPKIVKNAVANFKGQVKELSELNDSFKSANPTPKQPPSQPSAVAAEYSTLIDGVLSDLNDGIPQLSLIERDVERRPHKDAAAATSTAAADDDCEKAVVTSLTGRLKNFGRTLDDVQNQFYGTPNQSPFTISFDFNNLEDEMNRWRADVDRNASNRPGFFNRVFDDFGSEFNWMNNRLDGFKDQFWQFPAMPSSSTTQESSLRQQLATLKQLVDDARRIQSCCDGGEGGKVNLNFARNPQQLYEAIQSHKSIMQSLSRQRQLVGQQMRTVRDAALLQKLKQEYDRLDAEALDAVNKGPAKDAAWCKLFSQWQDLNPRLSTISEFLDRIKQKIKDIERMDSSTVKSAANKLKQLKDLERDLINNKQKLKEAIDHGENLLNSSDQKDVRRLVDRLKEDFSSLDEYLAKEIKKTEMESSSGTEFDAVLQDYDKAVSKANKQLAAATKLLEKKNLTADEFEQAQDHFMQAKKDTAEAENLKKQLEKVGSGLSQLQSSVDEKMKNSDDAYEKLLSRQELVEGKMADAVDRLNSPNEATDKLTEWLDDIEQSLKEDDLLDVNSAATTATAASPTTATAGGVEKPVLKDKEDVSEALLKYKNLQNQSTMQRILFGVLGFPSHPCIQTATAATSATTGSKTPASSPAKSPIQVVPPDSSVDDESADVAAAAAAGSCGDGDKANKGDAVTNLHETSAKLLCRFSDVVDKIGSRLSGLNELNVIQTSVDNLRMDIKKWIDGCCKNELDGLKRKLMMVDGLNHEAFLRDVQSLTSGLNARERKLKRAKDGIRSLPSSFRSGSHLEPLVESNRNQVDILCSEISRMKSELKALGAKCSELRGADQTLKKSFDDCHWLVLNTEKQLDWLKIPRGVESSSKYQGQIDQLKKLKDDYAAGSKKVLTSLANSVNNAKNLAAGASDQDQYNNNVQAKQSKAQSELEGLGRKLNDHLNDCKSLQTAWRQFEDLYDGVEHCLTDLFKQGAFVNFDEEKIKMARDKLTALEPRMKELEDVTGSLEDKLDVQTSELVHIIRPSLNRKADILRKKLERLELTNKAAADSNNQNLVAPIKQLNDYLTADLEPKLNVKLPNNTRELQNVLDDLRTADRQFVEKELKLNDLNEKCLKSRVAANEKSELTKLNSRFEVDGLKLKNLLTTLQDHLLVGQNFNEKLQEWEKYMKDIGKDLLSLEWETGKQQPQQQPEFCGLESVLLLQKKIKNFLEEVPTRQSTLQSLKSDVNLLPDDVAGKDSLEAKLALLENNWKDLLDRVIKRDIVVDSAAYLWRGYYDGKDKIAKMLKDAKNAIEMNSPYKNLDLEGLKTTVNVLKNQDENLTSIESKKMKELKSFSAPLAQLVADAKLQKQLKKEESDLLNEKNQLKQQQLKPIIDPLVSTSSELDGLDGRLEEYNEQVRKLKEQFDKPLSRGASYEEVLMEAETIKKQISEPSVQQLLSDKPVQTFSLDKERIKSKSILSPSVIISLENSINQSKQLKDATLSSSKLKIASLDGALKLWQDFDDDCEEVSRDMGKLEEAVGELRIGGGGLLDGGFGDDVDGGSSLKKKIESLESRVGPLNVQAVQLVGRCEGPRKSKVQTSVKCLQDRLQKLKEAFAIRCRSLNESGSLLGDLQRKASSLDGWLSAAEHQLTSTLVFANSQPAELDRHMRDYDNLQREFTARRVELDSINSSVDCLLANQVTPPSVFEARKLKKVKGEMNDKWAKVQGLLANRKQYLKNTESNWADIKKKHEELDIWLVSMEGALKQLLSTSASPVSSSKQAAEEDRKLKNQFGNLEKELKMKDKDFRKMTSLYGNIVRLLQSDEALNIKTFVDGDNKRYGDLLKEASLNVKKYENLCNMRDDFNYKLEELRVWLSNAKANLHHAMKEKVPKKRWNIAGNTRADLKKKSKQLDQLNVTANYLLQKQTNVAENQEVNDKVRQIRDLHNDVLELLKELEADGEKPISEEEVKEGKTGASSSGKPKKDAKDDGEDDSSKLRELEEWLDAAESRLAKDKCKPETVSEFESAIKILKDLQNEITAWRPDVASIRHSAPNLAQQTPQSERLCERISSAGARWDSVCSRTLDWDNLLRCTLHNPDFFKKYLDLLSDLLRRLTVDFKKVADTPVDDQTSNMKLKSLIKDLNSVDGRLNKLKPRLSALRRLHNHAIDNPPPSPPPSSSSSGAKSERSPLHDLTTGFDELDTRVGFLSDGVLEERARLNRCRANRPDLSDSDLDADDQLWEDADEDDENFYLTDRPLSSAAKSPRYWRNLLSRGVRVALPIQALMLILLGAAAIVPVCESNCFSGALYSFAKGGPPI